MVAKKKKTETDMSLEELENRKKFFENKIAEYGAKMDADANKSFNEELTMTSELECLDDMIKEFSSSDGKIKPKNDKELEESIIKRDKLKESVNFSRINRQTLVVKSQKKIEICKQKIMDIEADIIYITEQDEDDNKSDEEKIAEIKQKVEKMDENLVKELNSEKVENDG